MSAACQLYMSKVLAPLIQEKAVATKQRQRISELCRRMNRVAMSLARCRWSVASFDIHDLLPSRSGSKKFLSMRCEERFHACNAGRLLIPFVTLRHDRVMP